MTKSFLSLLAAGVLFAGNLAAQCGLTLSTSASTVCAGDNVTLTATATPPVTPYALQSTLTGGNNHRGNMFDIYATNTVTITSFDAHPMGNTTIAVYYRPGSYSGYVTSSAGWTLLGSAAVTAQPFGTATPVPVAVNVTIPAGQTYAFYVTSTNTSVSLNYTDGSSEGATYVSDANITFRQGVGLEYPFTNGTGGIFSPRVWNGIIHYNVPNNATYSYLWNTTATASTINPTVNATTQYTVQANVTGCPTMYDTIEVTVSTPPVSAGPDQSVCAGSNVTLAGSGAVSYSWNNAVADNTPFVPSATMSYVVTGTDTLGCTAMDTVMVTVNPLPNVSAGPDQSVCAGSNVTLAGSGAVSYSWDNAVTDNTPFAPASSMSYVVTGTDANGCVNTDTVMVAVNPLPAVYAGADQAVCAGTMITLTGSGAMSYSWDNNVQDNTPFPINATTSFVVTGTDVNGCMNTDTITIAVNPLPAVSAGPDQNVCANTPVTLTGTGSAFMYLWDNNVTDNVPFIPAGTATYVVAGIDLNGCMAFDTVTVTVNTVNVATSFLNETITASASNASYQWIDCSTGTAIAGATGQSYTATANGSYAVVVTQNTCADTSSCTGITTVGIADIASGDAFSAYPNPTSGQLTITTGSVIAKTVTIVDVTGKLIDSFRPQSAQITVDLGGYADGVYFVRILTDKALKTVRVTKN